MEEEASMNPALTQLKMACFGRDMRRSMPELRLV